MVRLMHLLICLALVYPGDGLAANSRDGWEPVSRTQQGDIYHQRVTGSIYPRVMIRTAFAAPPVEIYKLVNDYDHFENFVPNVRVSRVVHRAGNTQWVFHRLQFPGPVADRVYLLASSDAGSQPEHDQYRIEWQLSDRVFPGLDLSAGVRPERFSGHWLIEPAAQPGTSRAEYVIHSEPGGLLPAWLVRQMSDRYVRQLVDAIRRELARYQAIAVGDDNNDLVN